MKSNNDRVSEVEIPCPEQDGSIKYVEKLINRLNGLSAGTDNSSFVLKISCRIKNIYVIGSINASSVRLGDSEFGKDFTTKKVTPVTTTKLPGYNYSKFKPTKTCMPEYFDKSRSTEPSVVTSKVLRPSTAIEQETESKIGNNCHCPSRDNV
ncbi:uncharacterized protein LOC112686024 [Sipha flava]|jgi:hypothetical protein|uniref:Uncharacterized protein LOC112686024 n=1 Tax=Sipha flava TaxID=143950 RepID=A0A2S2QU38_9HEMI|nr:uncharacterized protein LOC112686024 [Sipha flava]